MDINKPLEDWEMICLAARMSIVYFDQIARGYLGIKKIRLDHIRENAGRNCINYMADSLTYWRDLQPQEEARQRLHSALTNAAADAGLVERHSFQFLITGEENDRYKEMPDTQRDLKQMQVAKLPCRSYPTPFLVVLTTLAFFCTFFLMQAESHWMYVPVDRVTMEFTGGQQNDFSFANYTVYVLWCSLITLFSLILILWSLVFECCLCYNVTYARTQRAQERDLCRFRFFIALIFLIYIPTACFCFIRYHQLKYFVLPKDKIVDDLELFTTTRVWDKIQIWFACCGTHNYTYWFDGHHKTVPDSCCRNYQPGCGKFTSLDQIFVDGCLPYVMTHVNEQMRHRTKNNQMFALISGLSLLLCCVFVLYLTKKEYYGDFMCCKVKPNIVERNDGQAVLMNNNGYVNDEAIVNIANNDVNEDVNGNVNLAEGDNVIVHEENGNSDEEILLQ